MVLTIIKFHLELYENNQLGQVKLKLTSDTDQQLNFLTKLMREETHHPGSSSWYRMGELLVLLGESDRAEYVCRPVLDRTFDDLNKTILYSML
jgi:hypothetical protein